MFYMPTFLIKINSIAAFASSASVTYNALSHESQLSKRRKSWLLQIIQL